MGFRTKVIILLVLFTVVFLMLWFLPDHGE